VVHGRAAKLRRIVVPSSVRVLGLNETLVARVFDLGIPQCLPVGTSLDKAGVFRSLIKSCGKAIVSHRNSDRLIFSS
jgi:hypothetical protein